MSLFPKDTFLMWIRSGSYRRVRKGFLFWVILPFFLCTPETLSQRTEKEISLIPRELNKYFWWAMIYLIVSTEFSDKLNSRNISLIKRFNQLKKNKWWTKDCTNNRNALFEYNRWIETWKNPHKKTIWRLPGIHPLLQFSSSESY